jgi:folylpolyglutamate synthase/dihydropteroate synthase
VETVEDPSLALAAAVETARAAGGPLICCGSLYLIGAVRGWLVDEPELRDPPAPGQDRR